MKKKENRNPGSKLHLEPFLIFLPYHYTTTPIRQNSETFMYLNKLTAFLKCYIINRWSFPFSRKINLGFNSFFLRPFKDVLFALCYIYHD